MNTDRLDEAQERAVAALLTHPTRKAAAAAIGVSESTLWRWMQRPGFQARYRRARRDVAREAMTTLGELTAGAVEALERNLRCGVPSVEVRSAVATLQLALQAGDLLELEDRVTELEEGGARATRAPSADGRGPKAGRS